MRTRKHGRSLRRRYGRASGSLQAVNKMTGAAVKPGASVTNFRGEKWKLVRPTRANEPGRDGKVVAKKGGWQQEFYAGVFDLAVHAS